MAEARRNALKAWAAGLTDCASHVHRRKKSRNNYSFPISSFVVQTQPLSSLCPFALLLGFASSRDPKTCGFLISRSLGTGEQGSSGGFPFARQILTFHHHAFCAKAARRAAAASAADQAAQKALRTAVAAQMSLAAVTGSLAVLVGHLLH